MLKNLLHKLLSYTLAGALTLSTVAPSFAQTTYLNRFTGSVVATYGKQPVDAATTTNIVLSGAQTIDGVAVTDNNRVLVKNQIDQTTNGIYVVMSSGAWYRAGDFNGPLGTVNGQLVYVTGGSTNPGTWSLTTPNPVQIDQSGGQSTSPSNITFSAAIPGIGVSVAMAPVVAASTLAAGRTAFGLGASAVLNQAFTTEGTLASATTTDLGTVASNIVDITGTTTITSFGSSASTNNPLYVGRFVGALTLTNNNTSLILPGAANITTAAGDTFMAKYEGSGNWRVISYSPATGKAVVSPTNVVVRVQQQTFASSGTYTPCTGLVYADVDELGGGGGGGGVSTSNGDMGGGGGAGGHSRAIYSAATVGSSQSVTVGAAGASGANTGGTGGTGGTTLFGVLLGAAGGVGGGGSTSNTVQGLGGTGGLGTYFGINSRGAPGGIGSNAYTNNNSYTSGYGANTYIGGGAAALLNTSTQGGANAQTNTGGGGSGATGSGSGAAGGAGASGVVFVTEYCNQ